MKRYFLSFLFVILFCSVNINYSQTVFYISSSGNDNNPGTIEKPFATFQKAQKEVRKIKGVVNIYVREGVYYFKEPVVFTGDDSRNFGEDVTYKTFQNERVVISGAIPLKLKWENYKNGIKQAEVKKDVLFDQLFINGKLQQMARYPNYNSTARVFDGTSNDAISKQRIKNWKNPAGGFLHALHKSEWGGFHFTIAGKDENGELILEGGWQNNRRMGIHDNHRFVENIFEELDSPHEWYFDKQKSIVYYYPPQNINLQTAVVETPQIKHLFEFRGTEQNPVKNISIEGFELTHTLRTFMDNKEPLLRSDWTIYRGAAVIMEGAENCKIKNCFFNSVGGNAIFFSNYNRNNEVSGCEISNAGGNAICFVGSPDAVRSPSFEYNEFIPLDMIDKTPGPKTQNFPANCLVYNNLIYNIGRIEKQVAGVQISMAQDITVSHNTIYDVPRAGINIGDGTWGGHIIEFNDVFNTVQETGDHGAFNSWGRDRYWHPKRITMDSIVAQHPELVLLDAVKTNVLRNNRFRCDHGWDIDLDDGSSNYHIYNNICLSGGLKLREGFYRTVENNIIINNSFHPHVWFKNSGDVFVRNIVTAGYLPIRITSCGKEVDYNVFPDSISLAKSQLNNVDLHSIYADNIFVNPDYGNYMIKENSSAFNVGFKNFDMESFGVISPILRAKAKQVTFPKLVSMQVGEDEIVDFLGMKVKNLNTLGERSATGMSSETGVLIIDVPSKSIMTEYFQPNDVILSFNKNKIARLPDLLNARFTVIGTSTEVIIFRNQQEIQLRILLK